MHFRRMVLSGIKNKRLDVELTPCTVITGPHESGKTAVLEAIRLCCTGRAEIGGTGAKISEIIEGGSAFATLSSESQTVSWQGKVGDTVSCKRSGPDLQGGMPASLKDFNALSAADAFALFGDNSVLRIESNIDQQKELLKKAKATLAVPAPTSPDMYDGQPKASLQKELDELSGAIQRHMESQKGSASREESISATQREIDDIQAKIQKERDLILFCKNRRDPMQRTKTTIQELLSQRDALKEPKFITWGRKQGLTCGDLIETVCMELAEAARWLAHKQAHIAAEQLERIECKIPQKIAEKCWEGQKQLNELCDGKDPDAVLKDLTSNISELCRQEDDSHRLLGSLEARSRQLQQNIDTINAIHAGMVETPVLEAWLARKEELQQLIVKCNAWAYYSEQIGKWNVNRSEAVEMQDEANEELERLNALRTQAVELAVLPVETAANATLCRLGLEPLQLLVEATAKRADLVVRVNGILLEALAGSRKFLYGLALLSAIHERSNAECPVLVAQCGELGPEMFKKAAEAFNPAKGNVVLEHWLEAGTENEIRLELQEAFV